uniref:Reverse transcriptase domain-containing protein n=1 Tax=Bos indicus x Bos taurus TaxID=30522 RepID=A0A4W2DCG9_BOBOX
MVEINESERIKEKRIKRNEDNLRDLQDNIKCYNIRIIGVPEEEDKKKDHEKILEEIIVENFPKMGKETITQVQETQRVPNRINPRRNTPRHILIKLTKIKHKEQILKAAREKQQITHKGIPVRITANLSIETLQARREWQDILKVMKENSLQPRLLYPARISFKYEGESITVNKASGGDGIPFELFQILKDDSVKMLHSICQQIWITQQWPQDWKRSVFIPIPKKGNAKECSNYRTIALISHPSKVMLKILQARFQQYVNRELPDVQAGFRKGRRTRYQIANIHWIVEKAREFQKNIYFCFIDYAKAFDCVDHNKLWKILKEMGIPDHLTCCLRNL